MTAARRGRRFWALVGLALLAGLGLRVAIGLTDDAPPTDETAYLRSGVSLAEGDGFARDGQPELHFPPFVPFLLGESSRLVDDPHTATVWITIVAGAAAVLPLALIGRHLAGDAAGIATAGVAATAPGLATLPVNRGAGTEAEYVLLAVTAVWLVLSAAERRGAGRMVRCAGAGACIGLAYLTRPEGLFIAAPLGLAVLYLGWRDLPSRGAREAGERATADGAAGGLADREPLEVGLAGGARGVVAGPAVESGTTAGRPLETEAEPGARRSSVGSVVRRVVPAAAAFALPIVACIVPYAVYLHDNTGKWELTAKTQDASIEAWHAVARGDRESRDSVLYALDASGEGFSTERASLPSLAQDDPVGYLGIVLTNVANVVTNIGAPVGGQVLAWALLPLPLTVLAGWAAWQRRRSRPVVLLLAVAALPVITGLMFFVQHRYLVVTAAVLAVLAGVGLAAVPERFRRAAVVTAAVFLAVSAVQAFNGPGGWWHPADHTDQRQAGEWLAEHTRSDDVVMSRSMVVEYYADRPTLAIPYADLDEILRFGRHYGARYLAVDTFTVTRLRPQLAELQEADEVPGLRLVHESTAEGRTTRIFALDPAPPPSDEVGPSLGFVGDGMG
ncbi:MAG TPA: glycosyltransferase family 39 protein [Acidimicrobiales bacterium]|nr:glycosyltransferase family 39 protein [Acidimicrobiales bacterium]